jgi:hypothetical protein
MTEEKGKPESEEKCCSDKSEHGGGKGGCGRYSGCKCFKAFILISLGLLAGYFLTRRCHTKKMMCCDGPSGQLSGMKSQVPENSPATSVEK